MLPFSRNERLVRLGGVRLGPLRLTRGRWYTVGPITVRRFFQFLDACSRLGMSLASVAPPGGHFGAAALRALAPLMVQGPMRPADLDRATAAQLLELASAFAATNDMAGLLSGVGSSSAGPEEDCPTWDIGDVCHFVVVESAGCYTHRQVLDLPMADFLSIRDSVRKLRGDLQGLPEGAEPLTDAERARISSLAKRAGLYVVE